MCSSSSSFSFLTPVEWQRDRSERPNERLNTVYLCTIYTKTRACILIFFLILYSWTMVRRWGAKAFKLKREAREWHVYRSFRRTIRSTVNSWREVWRLWWHLIRFHLEFMTAKRKSSHFTFNARGILSKQTQHNSNRCLGKMARSHFPSTQLIPTNCSLFTSHFRIEIH